MVPPIRQRSFPKVFDGGEPEIEAAASNLQINHHDHTFAG